jgi:hypothetical protein
MREFGTPQVSGCPAPEQRRTHVNAKLIAVASISVLTGFPAAAIDRQQTMASTCAQLQAVIQAKRTVLLQYPSGRSGALLYDRAVADANLCLGSGYGDRVYVQTRDTDICAVRICHPTSYLRP